MKILFTIVKIGVPVLAIAALLWLGSEFGILRLWPAEAAADARLKKRALDAFTDQQEKVDSTSSFDEAARLNKEAKEELARKQNLVSSTPPPLPQQHAPPLAPVVAPPAAPAAGQTVANLEDFRVIKDGSDDGEWEFQLDARQPWQSLPITVSDGDEVEFYASGLVCGGELVGCAGPNGQKGIAQNPLAKPGEHAEEFPLGSAWCQSLIGRIGSDTFQVGNHKTYTAFVGSNKVVQLMDNFRLPYIAYATGGFRVKITVRKKA